MCVPPLRGLFWRKSAPKIVPGVVVCCAVFTLGKDYVSVGYTRRYVLLVGFYYVVMLHVIYYA